MSDQTEKDISLKEDSCSCSQQETDNCDSIEELESKNKKVKFTVLQNSLVKTQPENSSAMINSSNSSFCSNDDGSYWNLTSPIATPTSARAEGYSLL